MHTIREVRGEVVIAPVDAILLRLESVLRVTRIAMKILAARAIRRAETPDLCAGGLFAPASVGHVHDLHRVLCISHNFNVVLDVVPEDVVSVDGETVGSGLNHRDGGVALGIDVGPVLVGFGVEDVVLEIDSVLGEYSEDALSALREIDMKFPGCTTGGGDVVGDVLGNGVVEVGVPLWVGELCGIGVSFQDICAFGELVEVEEGLVLLVMSPEGPRSLVLPVRMCGQIHG